MILKRLVMFDVTRILRWDIGRALNRPVPSIVWKPLAGWFGGPLLLGLVAAGANWRPSEGMELLVAASCAALAATPDLVRMLRARTTSWRRRQAS